MNRNTIAPMMSAIIAAALTLTGTAATPPRAHAAPDAFFSYTGDTPLAAIAPGTVLATRTVPYHVNGTPTAVSAVQLLYRTSDSRDRPTANLTSVLIPATGADPAKAVAYQSYYDSLAPEHSPSRVIAGQTSFGGMVFDSETTTITGFLALGYTVIVADTEGQTANFAAGPEYGRNTLDSIRAATRAPQTGLTTDTRIGLFGYSGGAIATSWAAALAPAYAPEVNRRLVGAASGGVLVNPARNLRYVSGSLGWSGIAVMALVGISRSYGDDFTTYLSDYGNQLATAVDKASIAEVMLRYPGLTWEQLAKPEYADPASVPPLTGAIGKINLGAAPTPTIPLFIGQGGGGTLEGTDGTRPGIGPGDGVMVTGDVRALARQYCDTGNTTVQYEQYDDLSHTGAQAAWTTPALDWLHARFTTTPTPSNCTSITPGNPLTAHF
ncbi:lipase family protein [Nocardia testacea]|uniref:Lipase family protein n=1 Tax=Nocardia testacea TaxID=248551 RepID=A0ABW7W0J5_9NOCA